MKIFVDIDETICSNPNTNKTIARNYESAIPIKENIKIINRLYDEGHEITYWTARGSGSGIDWYHITKKQLFRWEAKHHFLTMGKPIYDLMICDKVINSGDIEKNLEKFLMGEK